MRRLIDIQRKNATKRRQFQKEQQRLLFYWCDERNLWVAREHVRRRGGKTPGPDGLKINSLTKPQWFEAFRDIRGSLEDGSYQPGPTRRGRKKKLSGGYRIIYLANMIDRIVARAIYQFLEPWMDPFFDPRSFGFRPKLNQWHALREASRLTADESRTYWLCHDIRQAFDRVPQQRLGDLLRPWVPEPMLNILHRLIRQTPRLGIAQGSAISPLCLNYYLDHHLDRKWRKINPDMPLIRFADDLLVLCKSKREARRADSDLRSLLTPAGFPLKANFDDACIDLHRAKPGEGADWLGFETGGKTIMPRIAEGAWSEIGTLSQRIAEPEAGTKYITAIRSWLNYFGPAYKSYEKERGKILDRLESMNPQDGKPFPSRKQMRTFWRDSWRAWDKLLNTREPDTNKRMNNPKKVKQRKTADEPESSLPF